MSQIRSHNTCERCHPSQPLGPQRRRGSPKRQGDLFKVTSVHLCLTDSCSLDACVHAPGLQAQTPFDWQCHFRASVWADKSREGTDCISHGPLCGTQPGSDVAESLRFWTNSEKNKLKINVTSSNQLLCSYSHVNVEKRSSWRGCRTTEQQRPAMDGCAAMHSAKGPKFNLPSTNWALPCPGKGPLSFPISCHVDPGVEQTSSLPALSRYFPSTSFRSTKAFTCFYL